MFPIQRSASAPDIPPGAVSPGPSPPTSTAGSSESPHPALPVSGALNGLLALGARPSEPLRPPGPRGLNDAEKDQIRAAVRQWANEDASEDRQLAAEHILSWIDRGADEMAGTLDLVSLSLPNLPPGIERLPVACLLLSGNRLTRLPMDPDHGGFSSVRDLVLEGNPLEDIDRLGELTSLHALNLGSTGTHRIPVAFNALTQLEMLFLDEMGLTELPALGALTRIFWFTAARNALREAPDLRTWTRLEMLSLQDNQIEFAPDLSAQAQLLELDLWGNRLTVPPVFDACPKLRLILLGGNRLVALPDVRHLSQLTDLILANNQLTTLPPWIEVLPSTLTIDLRGNPLSEESMATIARLRRLGIGPTILDGQGVVHHDGTSTTLREQAGLWLAARPGMPRRQSLQERWAGFELEPGANEFTRMLAELTRTKDFQNSEASRQALGQRVADVLEVLARDDELRGLCFSAATEALGTCGDRVALTFGNIEAAARARALAGRHDELLKLAQGMHRLALLDEITAEEIRNQYHQRKVAVAEAAAAAAVAAAAAAAEAERTGLPVEPVQAVEIEIRVEEVEIALAYRVKLAKALELPGQPEHMLYAACANLSEEKLERALRSVLDKESDPAAFIAFIASKPFWQASLETQPACTEAIAQLGERRTQQTKDLNRWDKPRRQRATQEERDSDDSELTLNYKSRFGEIMTRYEEGVQSVHRQFTRIAMDRVKADLPPIDAALQPPPHVIAAAKLSDIAVRLQGLIRKGEAAEAGILACQLLEPELLAALHPAQRRPMGEAEAKAMDIVNVQYMDLLRILAAEELLDGVAFDRLRGADTPPEEEEAPYLLYIASRAAPELTRAAAQLITTLAETRELGNGQDRKELRAEMLAALRRSAQAHGLDKDHKDFFKRCLTSGATDAGKLGSQSLQSLQSPQSPQSQPSGSRTVPDKDEELAKVVRTLGEQNVAAAHADHVRMQREQDAARQAQQHADNVRSSIYSAVHGAVDALWATGAGGIRKELLPPWYTFLFDSATAAASADAASSLSDTAPDSITTDICNALRDSAQGKALLQALDGTGQIYDKQNRKQHPAFEKLLQATVAHYVQFTLEAVASGLRKEAWAKASASKAWEALEQAERELAENAAADEATSRVQAGARQTDTSSGALASTSDEGPRAKRARPTVPASPQGADSSSAQASAERLLMPNAPQGPIGDAARRPAGPAEGRGATPSRR